MSKDRSELDLMMRFGGPFPWHGTYQGEPVVMITVEELRRLQRARSRAEKRAAARRRTYVPKVRVTQWDRDPELATFVRERLGRVEQIDILREAEVRFGKDRAPTKSALSRFAVKWSLDRYRISGGGVAAGLDGVAPSTAVEGRQSNPLTFDR